MTEESTKERRQALSDFLKGGTLTDGSVNPNTLNTLERYLTKAINDHSNLLLSKLPEMWLADSKYRSLAADPDNSSAYFEALGHDKALDTVRTIITSNKVGDKHE